ncbi:hypothetical protein BSKO_07996 [Bryopsis sp. KO-2023]|nr:hypothetical protein BSKO_07996 [Bryopsis sp. KO-2023]
MGKKSSQGKRKKEERLKAQKEVEERRRHVQDVIDRAKKGNPFDNFVPFHHYERNGLNLQLSSCNGDSIEKDILEWCHELCKRNMLQHYEPVWGWSDAKKRKQLEHPDSRFIIGLTEDKKPAAYVQFRYEDENCPVLYIYELQLEPECQRKGLGRFLMQLCELMARSCGMEAMMLTVLLSNHAAVEMYKKMGYVMDETSPGVVCPLEEYGYEILRKQFPSVPGKENKTAA